MLELVIIAIGTAFATGLGAIPVFLLGSRAERLRPVLLGIAAGVMSVAALAGLLEPALDDGSVGTVAAGFAAGVIFLLVARRALLPDKARDCGSRPPRLAARLRRSLRPQPARGLGPRHRIRLDRRRAGAVHRVAIAVQNIPEGTSVAIPMEAAGYGAAQQFWAAVGTSAPQPVGAVIAYLAVDKVSALLPLSFAFAAGAMLALVAVEVLPEALRGGRRGALAGAAIGAAAMYALSSALGV